MTLGVLTLATPNDYRKAIGLALSVKASNPGIPLAVACSPKVGILLDRYFDHVIPENNNLRGFVHKVHLDRYSPFDETFFFDSDVLVFRSLAEIIDEWRIQPYTACGVMTSGGFSSFGLDRVAVLKKIGQSELVQIDGAGHAYFRKPDCAPIFDLAREITATYESYAGSIKYADEDVMNIAMTILGLKPMNGDEFFSRHLSGKPGTRTINAANAECSFIAVTTGREQRPHMMHFAANEAPFTYAQELNRLFKLHGVNTSGLYREAFADWFRQQIVYKGNSLLKRLTRKA
jgi:hypothetical protein